MSILTVNQQHVLFIVPTKSTLSNYSMNIGFNGSSVSWLNWILENHPTQLETLKDGEKNVNICVYLNV